jgi:hypothetical protein
VVRETGNPIFQTPGISFGFLRLSFGQSADASVSSCLDSIWELSVQDWVILVKFFAELIGNHFEAGAKLAGIDAKTEMLVMVV